MLGTIDDYSIFSTPFLMGDTITNDYVFFSYIVNMARVLRSTRLIDFQANILNATAT